MSPDDLENNPTTIWKITKKKLTTTLVHVLLFAIFLFLLLCILIAASHLFDTVNLTPFTPDVLFLGVLLLFVGCAMIWNAGKKLENSDQIVAVHVTALYASIICLVIKELLFRYLLNVAKRAKSSLLLANAWHARSDAASSLVVAIGIIFNLLGYHSFDLIAAIIVGVMILKMGWTFSYEAIHALTDKAADTDEVEKIKKTILETPGVVNLHDLRTRKVGDSIIADVHIEVKGTLTVAEGHAIAVEARNRVMRSSRVLNLMTHIDPV